MPMVVKKVNSPQLVGTRRLHRAPRGCAEDESGPNGVDIQKQASKHLKLLWSNAMVVSV